MQNHTFGINIHAKSCILHGYSCTIMHPPWMFMQNHTFRVNNDGNHAFRMDVHAKLWIWHGYVCKDMDFALLFMQIWHFA